MNESQDLYVRLLPYNKRTGHLRRRFDLRIPGTAEFLTFTKPGLWYRVDARIGELLRKARQKEDNPMSPPVFDVCSEAEAREMDRLAKEERERARVIVEPSVETATDLTIPEKRNRASALSDFNAEVSGTLSDEDDEGEAVEAELADFSSSEAQAPVAVDTPDESWKVTELKDELERRGIEIPRRARKADLLELLS